MSLFPRFDLFDPSLLPLSLSAHHLDSLFIAHDLHYCSYSDPLLALDLLNPNPSPFDLCPFFDLDLASADLASFRRFRERAEAEASLRSLGDRVAALELGFRRAGAGDRRYKWTAEIGGERKYQWSAVAKGSGERSLKWKKEIKGEGDDGFDRKYKWEAERKLGGEGGVKWTAEFKGKGKREPLSHTYSFHMSTPKLGKEEEEEEEEEEKKKKGKEKKKEKKEKKKEKACAARAVEIEETNPGAIVVRRAFARSYNKGKRKELSPQDAALLIQMSFRAHLARRSQVLRCLRDLAIAKAKLKEIRALFTNFSYRRRIAHDAEERQRFSEKIIILLLTVDALEGPDYMVRTAKKSMVDELEAMLEVVDPQPPGKLSSLRRRTFDLPDSAQLSKDMASSVEEAIHLIEREA